MRHSLMTGAQIHVPFAYEYADATAREAATGFTVDDVGKFAHQLDNHSIWILTDNSPETWVFVSLDIDSLTEELTPTTGDMFVMSRAGALYKVDADNLPGGGGGGGGGTINDRTWVRGSTADARDDEFNDGSIAGAWTRVDNAGHSSYVTWTEAGDSLSLLLNGGDASAELHAYLKSYSMSIGDYIQCKIRGGGASSNYPIAGLIIADGTTYGAGAQAFFPYFLSSGAAFNLSYSEWSGFNSRSAFTDVASAYFGLDLHLRLKYSAANTFEYYFSVDGISWILIGTRTITLTPTHIGIAGSTYGGATPFIFSFDYFRVNP